MSRQEEFSEEEKPKAKAKKTGGLIAKRAHVVHHNDHHFDIKEGDDVSHVPDFLLVSLRTEKVID